jgi:Calcineurin-like phosphoesterase
MEKALLDRIAVPASFLAGVLLLSFIGLTSSFDEATAGPPDPIFVGSGDISTCTNDNDEATAQLLDAEFLTDPPGAVFTTGDLAYESGTTAQFNSCYDPTWGRHKARTNPSPGNHEYQTLNATGYYAYFGSAAGNPTEGYYSYDIGEWHAVVINTSDGCGVIGCGAGSAQEQWLRNDLAASDADCTVAYWHHPRFSSGMHGNDTDLDAIWRALFDHGVDLVLNGHDHNYERFALQDPDANPEPVRGIREIVVGTGGRSLRPFETIRANSEVRDFSTYGVLKVTLHATSYDWQFIPAPPGTFIDSGTQPCLTPDIDDDGDGDGCTDLDELRTVAGSETAGGRRDPAHVWDFFDVPTGAPPARDGAVAGPDFFAILSRFGATGDTGIDPLSAPPDPPAYHTAYDRGGPAGADPWDLAMADGAIAGPDFFSMLGQFGHACD